MHFLKRRPLITNVIYEHAGKCMLTYTEHDKIVIYLSSASFVQMCKNLAKQFQNIHYPKSYNVLFSAIM